MLSRPPGALVVVLPHHRRRLLDAHHGLLRRPLQGQVDGDGPAAGHVARVERDAVHPLLRHPRLVGGILPLLYFDQLRRADVFTVSLVQQAGVQGLISRAVRACSGVSGEHVWL